MIVGEDVLDQTDMAETEGGWADLLRPRYFVSTVMLSLGVALFAFNEFFVSTAMPSAVKELGQPWLLAWAFTLYLVFAIVGGALAAYLKGRLGGRATLIVATIVFAAGTLCACLASHWLQLLVARLLQGAGEGITISLCYALIPELFPKPLVQKVFGTEAVAWAAAAFGGPLIAGLLTEYVSWRAAFASSLPAAAIFFGLVLWMVPGRMAGSVPPAAVPLLRLLLLGAGILMISVSSAISAVLAILVLLVAAAGLLALFIRLDRGSSAPLLPEHAFRPARLPGAGLWVNLLMPFGASAAAVYLVYGLQAAWGLTPAEAGAASAVLALCWSFAGIAVASARSGLVRSRLIAAGPALLALGVGCELTALLLNLFWLVYPGQAIVGVGFGVSWGPLSQLLIESVPESERDKTSALLPVLHSAGYAIGGAAFGLIATLAGLGGNSDAEAVRSVLLPVFAVALLIALCAARFGFLTMRVAIALDRVGQ